MAKRRRISKTNRYGGFATGRRVTYDNANRRRLPLKVIRSTAIATVGDDARRSPKVQRYLYPTLSGRRVAPLATVNIPMSHKTRRAARSNTNSRLWDVKYILPESSVLCARRKVRREVIFATNNAGRSGQKRPKYNQNSKISCRS
jgi:hypothetical protein